MGSRILDHEQTRFHQQGNQHADGADDYLRPGLREQATAERERRQKARSHDRENVHCEPNVSHGGVDGYPFSLRAL